ncbi:SPOR domain-containing protein [Aliivibrio fischeri]|uniref:DedD protein n=2 Tax=Aliivibrio fischeri TaxID=668 RepID=B5FFN3_ALIFM|nr:SPOR domain-containing protein [Aliivibrio fischeri]ACH65931.1 DedD protein [Aliivibrio fischeri MJ11]EHN70131.1 DedD protein [Aliivibrio fischeri SR5]MCE4934743.1 SPOR domain-containing protein [Aliivibrio fischeri]MUH97832.1 cell division protein DedD [Aliivibrio fischeri]MUI63281.1 cell division protein DedD [Aliivibrio fischeri]
MSSPFQRRLVGTIILVAIGVIVLPDLFDGKKKHYQEEFASIPIKPELSKDVEQFEIQEPVDFDAELPDEPVEVTIESSPTEPEKETLTIVEKKQPQPSKVDYAKSAWIIQLGVFRNADNAKNLALKLRKQGYQAHTFPKDPQPGDLVRVAVGPDVSKPDLEKQLPKLKEITGLNGQLLKFTPLNP